MTTDAQKYTSYANFCKQVRIIEGLNIHVVGHESRPLFPIYPYKSKMTGKNMTIMHLKVKRMDKLLQGMEYYFYDRALNDIFPNCCRLSECIQTIAVNEADDGVVEESPIK